MRSAGFWDRVLATLVDCTLLTVVVALLLVPTAVGVTLMMAQSPFAEDLELAELVGRWLTYLWILVPGWPYSTLLESCRWQATLCKRVLGLRVTDEAGQKISLDRANGRYWSKLISAAILGLGFLMAAVTEQGQALHDKMAGTRVVKVAA
jgi:uncharacterized RDD family membrane protein YckC